MTQRPPLLRYRTGSKLRRLTATACVAVALAGCQGSPEAPEKPQQVDRVTYLTGFNITGQDAFVYAAIEKGYFRDAGLEVTVMPGKGTGENLKLLAAGQAQFAIVDLTGALIEYGSGRHRDFTVFAAIYQRSVSCVTALEGAGITRPKDLEGRTIGYQPGGVNDTLFPTFARLAGIDPTKVKLQQALPPQLRPLLAAGKVDAIMETVVGKSSVEAAAGKPAVLLPFSDVLRDLYGNALATSATTATGNPRIVTRFRDAMLRGLTFAVDNPDEAARMLGIHQRGYKEELARAEVRSTIPFVRDGQSTGVGAINELRVTQSIAILQGANAIPAGIKATSIISTALTASGPPPAN